MNGIRYEAVLTGLTPLLMHQDSIENADLLDAWRKHPDNKKKSKAGDDRSPAWTWKTYCYNDGKHITIPSDNLRAALLRAGMKIPQAKGRGSLKADAVADIVYDAMDYPLLIAGKPVSWSAVEAIDNKAYFSEHVASARGMGFDLFVKRAKIGQSKHIRVRPKFSSWSMRVTFEVFGDTLTDDTLTMLWDIAGARSGLGDWIPSAKTPGPYGRFSAAVKRIK
jgi:hypothetical protein